MLFRNLTHLADLMSYFADAEPEWVFAELEAGFEDYGTEYHGNGQDPSLEPAANAYIAYANGVRGYLTGQKTVAGGAEFELGGATGRILLDAEGLRIQKATDDGVVTRP